VGSVIAGSAPGAALFFVTYEQVKSTLHRDDESGSTSHHMIAASLGEIAACTVRVPTEVVKQRAQASQFASSWQALKHIFVANTSTVGIWRELYRGWGITMMREIPFTVIQFPLWEAMKSWRGRQKGRKPNPVESAVFGSISGAIAAGLTTPLDVLKTRLILAKQVSGLCALTREIAPMMFGHQKQSAISTFKNIIAEEGTAALFKGITPRVIWISIGGAIFLGAWDFAKGTLEDLNKWKTRS
jgi:solute carrier family 25 S-adenosylmethionine transporter 26